MNFRIIDSESAYRRLLDAPDAAARQAIFDAEIAAPFAGLAQMFGGPAAFSTWGMDAETWADRTTMQPKLDALAGADAWNRAARALVVGRDAFAAELYGADKIGPWVTAFDDSSLDQVKAIFREGLDRTGFNIIRAYIFGDDMAGHMGVASEQLGLPLYAGYAIGYRVAQNYLKRTGKTVAEATFVPVDEIIAESCFFAS